MTNRTRWSSLALALVLCAGLGCGGKAEKPAEPSTPRTRGAATWNIITCNRLYAQCAVSGICTTTTFGVKECSNTPNTKFWDCAATEDGPDPRDCFD